MRQPTATDDVAAWRRYAGELRQRLGDAKRDAAIDRVRLRRARFGKERDAKLLTEIERDLDAGDVPAAVDRLARRREDIAAALEGRDET